MTRIHYTREQDLDCGSHACRFAVKKTGMRTNGRCTCVDRLLSTIFEKTKRIAQLEEQITYLQTISTEQVERIRTLVAFYDKHHGTPCEQIRHAQEVAELKEEIVDLKNEITQLESDLKEIGNRL